MWVQMLRFSLAHSNTRAHAFLSIMIVINFVEPRPENTRIVGNHSSEPRYLS